MANTGDKVSMITTETAVFAGALPVGEKGILLHVTVLDFPMTFNQASCWIERYNDQHPEATVAMATDPIYDAVHAHWDDPKYVALKEALKNDWGLSASHYLYPDSARIRQAVSGGRSSGSRRLDPHRVVLVGSPGVLK